MTQEDAPLTEQNDRSEKKDGNKYISVHKLRHIVSFDEKTSPEEDYKCCSSPPRQPTSYRIGKKVSEVQRRISVKELRHVMVDEEPTPTPAPCNGHSRHTGRKNATEGTISANQLFSLIEKRTNEKRKNIVEKFISALTLHGYAQFHEAKGIRKILWALILTAMAVFIVRLTYLSYRAENYYKQVIEFETRKVKELDFPTVTVCSYLPVYTHEMHERFPINITEKDFKQFYYDVISNRGTRQDFRNRSAREFQSSLIRKLYKKGYASYTDVLGLFEKQGEKDINSEFVDRVVKGEKCVIENRPCDFETLFKTVYRHKSQSLCKQFNSYKKGEHGLVSTGNDRENGLSMFWDISGETYFRDTSLNGLLMEIHPYGTPHHIIDHRRTIYLEPGFSINIDVEEIMTERLRKPFKPNCEEQERQILKDFPYSKSVCELECFLEEAVSQCGCMPDQFAEYAGHIRPCNITEMKCIFETSSSQHCHDCPVQCVENDYKISTSRLGIGNDWVYKAVKDMKGWENKSQTEIKTYIGQNIVGFRIGFLSLDKQVRTYKEAVPWHERISMLGGIMGLLLGFSVITGFEFIFFLFDYFYIAIKYRCTKEYLSAVLQHDGLKTPMSLRRKWTSIEKQKERFLV